VANDHNHAYDVFVCNLDAGTNEMISVRQPALPSQTSGGAAWGPIYSVNSDGHYIAFCGTGNDLLAAGYTNIYRGVFVHDQFNNSNVLASADTNGLGGADGWAFDPSISGDGRYVAFTSSADNLVTGDNNASQDVFVRDLQTGTTTLVSINVNGNGPGNLASYSPTISTDGRFVLFHSKAGNLAGGSFNGSENLFLRDLRLENTFAISTSISGFSAGAMTPDGHFTVYGRSPLNGFIVRDSQTGAGVLTNSTSTKVSAIAISPDGNRIVYSITSGFYVTDQAAHSNWLIGSSLIVSNAGMQFTADSRYLIYTTTAAHLTSDTNGVADVYFYDFQTHSNFLVSQSYLWSGAANGASDSPTVSPDGRFIVYCSVASDIVPGTANGQRNVFMFDRQTGTTTLLSASLFGTGPANNSSTAPIFSGDGHSLVFRSSGSDLTAGDFNQSSDLFALVFLYAGINDANGTNPTLNWPVSSGQTYNVEYTDDLMHPNWQPLPGIVIIQGNRGFLTDTIPASTHRFYRVTTGN
jgi:Tol biopolymer transport system component